MHPRGAAPVAGIREQKISGPVDRNCVGPVKAGVDGGTAIAAESLAAVPGDSAYYARTGIDAPNALVVMVGNEEVRAEQRVVQEG
jgi:hypothetical protein